MDYGVVKKASEVRANFREFLDEVIRERPVVIERYGADSVFALSKNQMTDLLGAVKLTFECEAEEDGSISGSLIELPIVENAADTLQLRRALAQSAMEYVNTYMEGYPRYVASPEMQRQLPYVMKVLIQPDISAVMDLING